MCLLVYLGNAHLARLDTQPVTDLVGQVCVAAPTEHLSIRLVTGILTSFEQIEASKLFCIQTMKFLNLDSHLY